jgi:nucleoside-triphosphatase THEP1
MHTAVPQILLTGPPRSGKTTLICRLVHELSTRGVQVGGFVTREIRAEGERVGFTVAEIGGPRALLAHVALTEGPKVSRYRVDVAAFEGLALPAIGRATRQGGGCVRSGRGWSGWDQERGRCWRGGPIRLGDAWFGHGSYGGIR